MTLDRLRPVDDWIADSSAGDALWHRLMPQATGPVLNPLAITDDSQIVYALQNLPSIDLPPIEQLFILLIAYIALIGPINYLVLRRLDKREWAWVTIPALVIVFAFGSYGLGATLKGSDVIVNQITVVRAAQGTGRGIGQAYIGVYSPSRRSFDVRIPGGALLSNPASQAQMGITETPLDVIFGQSNSRLRNFEVGFGVLRGFRAEAPADSPEITSDLRLRRTASSQGTVTNESDSMLENVAVLFSGGTAVLPTLGPGETKDISLDVTSNPFFGYGLSEQIFGSTFPRDSGTGAHGDDATRCDRPALPVGQPGFVRHSLAACVAERPGPGRRADGRSPQPRRRGPVHDPAGNRRSTRSRSSATRCFGERSSRTLGERLGRRKRHVPVARHDDGRGPAGKRSTARSRRTRWRSR